MAQVALNELCLARDAVVPLHKVSLQRRLLKTDGLQRLGTMESDEAGFGPAESLQCRQDSVGV